MRRRTVLNMLITLLALGWLFTIQSLPEAGALLNSPLPTPIVFDSPLPLPAPGASTEASRAVAHLAQREGIASEALVIVNEFRRDAPLLGRRFQAVTILDTKSEHFFQVLVNLNNGQVEDRMAIEEAEAQRQLAQYGKLQPALHEQLERMQTNETVTVTIWVVAQPEKSLTDQQATAFATLAARYPEAQEALAHSGKPMDVDNPALSAYLYNKYVQILDDEVASRIHPLVQMLEAQESAVATAPGLPAVTVTLSRRVIEEIAMRRDVGMIYLANEGQRRSLLNSAVSTNLAPAVWASGYDGTGVAVAILEDGNVDFTSHRWSECPDWNNCFRHQGPTLTGAGEDWHTTLVASAVASDHNTYKGMAPGATIMSAGIGGPNRQDDINALVWALNQGADVINASYGWCLLSTQMDPIDRAFDHYARSRHRLFVIAAGNNDMVCPTSFVLSPAKGWNVFSVGAYDDQNDSNWANDDMVNWSAWVNPSSPNGDREKPEVVAPGVSITGIELDGSLRTEDGTSFAAPQVAGLAALLIHRNPSLAIWPEATKAIIMASATHNIEGPTGIPSGQDLRDGAGGINAALADTIARTRNLSEVDPCTKSCWWGIGINNSDFPVGNYLYRNFTANRGDFIRIAIAWLSNADCSSENNCNYDRLDTDLHLGVRDPNGQLILDAWSASWDNNYEMVEFVAPKTGIYRIAIYKARANETTNSVGIALVRLHRVHLPLVMSNFQ